MVLAVIGTVLTILATGSAACLLVLELLGKAPWYVDPPAVLPADQPPVPPNPGLRLVRDPQQSDRAA
ncbi:MAG TPA: hypothetical protein VG452_08205 [Egibacteraceae bacterium]|nr:hypothetical protein [Actinomycetota bacterium]HWB72187.1 hypothetical protein [Egibacteraceae bacterium]